MNEDTEQFKQNLGGTLMSPQNFVVPRHSHTGVDSPQLDPINFRGWPTIQVSDATIAPTDIPQTGTFRFYIDTTPHYYLWTYLAYNNGGTITGAWKGINLAGTSSTTHPTIQVFTSSGTYTPTAGITGAVVEVVGGGGGAGLKSGGSGVSNAGGGGGYARKSVTKATIGTSQTITIGAGGTGGVGTATDGGTTSFGSICSASGGLVSGGGNNSGGAGGTGTGGDVNITGQSGHAPIGSIMADGGNSVYGFGGSYGGSGTGYGGGGGSNGTGSYGNGSAGICIITEYYS